MSKHWILSAVCLCLCVSPSPAADILIMNQSGRMFDEDLQIHFESRGHTVEVLDTGVMTPEDQVDLATEADVVYVSESLGSSSVTDGLETFIKGVETPVIHAEAFAFDDAAMTGDVIHEDFGNTFRGDPPVVELQDGQDSIVIADPNHPIAAAGGFNGTVQVYNDIYSLNFGLIETMGPGVDVVATVDGSPDHATLFVYEQGAELEDGEPAAGMRIGFFLGQGAGDPQWDNLHENGIALLDATLDYALGLIGGDVEPALLAGDADRDLDFDQLDLVKVQVAGKYLTGNPATWGDGDWDGAPGGTQAAPPAGNGLFDQIDIIGALGPGHYLTGPYAALSPGGGQGDGQTSIGYNPGTGEVFVDAPAGTELTSINVDSASGIFTGDAAANLGGSFDNDADNNIFKATFGGSFGSISFGNVAQSGLSEASLLNDLTVVGSLAGGGDLGNVDLIYVPEPSALLLILFGVACLARLRRRK